ncbi:CTD small phosphatase-like protein 2-B isoform X2 [Heptranchias perlo]|uniref:CTD small phosphatase-like protein 2-B isoform X2 n=1 Tax=Heptranchias perlo TaxID=212740 RepID=UPI00355A54E6
MNLRSGKATSAEPLTPRTWRCTTGRDEAPKTPLGRGLGEASKTPRSTKKREHVTSSRVPSEEYGDKSDSFTTTPRATRLPGKHWQNTELNRGFECTSYATKLNLHVRFQDEHQRPVTRSNTKVTQALPLSLISPPVSHELETDGDLEPMEWTFSINFSVDSTCLYNKRKDFNQYKFIQGLSSSMKKASRKSTLPLKTRSVPDYSLVLGLDETLVHCQLTAMENAEFVFPVHFQDKNYQVYVRLRPYCKKFLESLSELYEIILFTSATKDYTDKLLDILDPHRRVIRHRLYRKHCVCVQGNYIRELTVLGRDLARTVIVDSSAEAFAYQIANGIQIKSWFKDPRDQELRKLVPFLQKLAELDDVRPVIQRTYQLDRL